MTKESSPKRASETGLTSRMPRVRNSARPLQNKGKAHTVSQAVRGQFGLSCDVGMYTSDTIEPLAFDVARQMADATVAVAGLPAGRLGLVARLALLDEYERVGFMSPESVSRLRRSICLELFEEDPAGSLDRVEGEP